MEYSESGEDSGVFQDGDASAHIDSVDTSLEQSPQKGGAGDGRRSAAPAAGAGSGPVESDSDSNSQRYSGVGIHAERRSEPVAATVAASSSTPVIEVESVDVLDYDPSSRDDVPAAAAPPAVPSPNSRKAGDKPSTATPRDLVSRRAAGAQSSQVAPNATPSTSAARPSARASPRNSPLSASASSPASSRSRSAAAPVKAVAAAAPPPPPRATAPGSDHSDSVTDVDPSQATTHNLGSQSLDESMFSRIGNSTNRVKRLTKEVCLCLCVTRGAGWVSVTVGDFPPFFFEWPHRCRVVAARVIETVP